VFSQAFFALSASAGWFGSSKPAWSDEDKRNFCHFLYSQRADGRATDISNSTSSYASQAEVSQLLSYWRLALQEASRVSDTVLDKTHPGLREKYRNQYQSGLQYQIAAFEQRNAEYSITGAKLNSDFVDWFSAARNQFKVPKGTVSACR